jgi:hypothetical protein
MLPTLDAACEEARRLVEKKGGVWLVSEVRRTGGRSLGWDVEAVEGEIGGLLPTWPVLHIPCLVYTGSGTPVLPQLLDPSWQVGRKTFSGSHLRKVMGRIFTVPVSVPPE